jgi:hypothetical protein
MQFSRIKKTDISFEVRDPDFSPTQLSTIKQWAQDSEVPEEKILTRINYRLIAAKASLGKRMPVPYSLVENIMRSIRSDYE